MPSGVTGFDEIADGGLPRGGVTVVLGGAGAGKTIFGMQVLAHGAGEMNEPGILVAFEESAARVMANTSGFVWGGDALSEKGVHVLDTQLSQSVEQGGEFDLIGLLAILAAKVEQVGARRIVFDGLDVLLGYLEKAATVRREAFRLRDWVHQSGLSAIVTAKADAAVTGAATDFDFLQFMADCVVTLHHRVVQGTAVRSVRVSKYRGAAHSANEFPITITPTGLELAANTSLELAHAASTERISSGVERLDTMLSGGYYRGSSILITGAPGTAKTTLAVAFAEAASQRGERTLFVSFDESQDQIVRNAKSIGIDLGTRLAAGTILVRSLRGRADSPGVLVARIRSLVRETRPRNLVVDPLSALSQRGFDTIAEGAALEVLDLAKSAGITLVFTSLLGTSTPLSEQTPLNISSIADTWMHLSYVSQGGERNRALTIVKSRGTGHSNQVRELTLTNGGVTLTDVYVAQGKVLMGVARWEWEQEEGATRNRAHAASELKRRQLQVAQAEAAARLQLVEAEMKARSEEIAVLALATGSASELVTVDREVLRRMRYADAEVGVAARRRVAAPVATTEDGGAA